MTIYKPNGDIIKDAPITKAAVEKYELMGEHYVLLSFESIKTLTIPVGSFIRYKNVAFTVVERIKPDKLKGKRGYKYDIKFYAPQHRMKQRRLAWLSSSRKETTFQLTTTLASFADLVVENMKLQGSYPLWFVGSLPESSETKSLHFDGVTCWEAVESIADAFKCEWWVTMDSKGYPVLNFGKLEYGNEEEFREGDVVTSFPAFKGDDSKYGTRFYIFGGSRNIPSDYYTSEIGGTTNHISEKRLHLPDGREYIDAWENLAESDIIEQVVNLDNIYPKSNEGVTDVTTKKHSVVEGEENTVYIIHCDNTSFIPTNESIIDQKIYAYFTSGSLEGREFELTGYKYGESFEKRFEIIAQTESVGGEDVIVVPNEYLRPAVGDTFVLTGIKLPECNITAAEEELLAEGLKYVAEHSSDTNVYDCPTNPVYCKEKNKNYQLGQRVLLIGGIFGGEGRASRIQGYEKKLYNPYEAIYSVGDNRKYTRADATGNSINKLWQTRGVQLVAIASNTSSQVLRAERLSLQAQTTANKASEGLSANEKALFAIEKRLTNVENNTSSTDISALKTKVDNNSNLLTQHNVALATLKTSVDDNTDKLKSQGAWLVLMDAQITNIDKRVTNVENTARVVVVTPNQ